MARCHFNSDQAEDPPQMADQNEVLFQTSLTQDYAQAEGDPAEAAEEVPDQQQEEREHEDMMAEEEAAPLPVVAMDQEEEEVGVEVASLEEHGQARQRHAGLY
ncbi:unnamed protein product [Durusdinium trenchii]|uniref:Uncharacterized protein n=1 Tax=Durusdinium trenchii TaxID=1381693 RepID=A0ABP0H574_9DINO